MGACHSAPGGCVCGACTGCVSCSLEDDAVTAVSLRHAPRARERWARKVGRFTFPVRELLFADGKVLADYASFLRNTEPSLMASLWQLSLARFAQRWSKREQASCAKLARGLGESWRAYLESPQGYGTFEDLSKWHHLAVHLAEQDEGDELRTRSSTRQTLHQAPEAAVGNVINEEHSRYVFAVSAMFGIHVSTLCHRICENATAYALGSASFAEIFDRTFPRLSYLECLQNSCYTYRIPPEGSAYSPPTEELTGGQLDVAYFVDDFCPHLFSQVRRLCGVSDQQYFHSICRPDVEFVEFLATSKSGEFFFFSSDYKYLLKTAKRFEAEALLRMLPDMIDRFERCPQSLLGRYLGLYRVYGEEVDCDVLFFVMQSATQHSLPIHSTYDLKGCTGRHRKAKPGESVKKDVDWLEDFGDLQLSAEDADHLLLTHTDDLAVLKKHGITDYSILLQVHDRKVGCDPELSTSALSFVSQGAATRLAAGASCSLGTWSPDMVGNEVGRPATAATAATTATNGVSWVPAQGISSFTGRYLYSMALIDLLVPWTWKGKVEFGCNELLSCGGGQNYSRLPPEAYARRQLQMMERMCGRPAEDNSDTMGSSEEE